MQIIVVDDEGIVLESCRRILEPEGFKVLLAKSADEALFAIEEEPPALLLVDVKMPVHDGIYLMAELKKRNREVPIILMSGLNTEDTIAEADKMGACRFLAKPFTPDELLETVRQAIDDREKSNE